MRRPRRERATARTRVYSREIITLSVAFYRDIARASHPLLPLYRETLPFHLLLRVVLPCREITRDYARGLTDTGYGLFVRLPVIASGMDF